MLSNTDLNFILKAFKKKILFHRKIKSVFNLFFSFWIRARLAAPIPRTLLTVKYKCRYLKKKQIKLGLQCITKYCWSSQSSHLQELWSNRDLSNLSAAHFFNYQEISVNHGGKAHSPPDSSIQSVFFYKNCFNFIFAEQTYKSHSREGSSRRKHWRWKYM